jgi:hypothetical protein
VDIRFATCICHGDPTRIVVSASVSEARVVECGSVLTCWITTIWQRWISTMSPRKDDIIQCHYEEKEVEDNGYNLPENTNTKM